MGVNDGVRPQEFDCPGCGRHVIRFVPGGPYRCGFCQTLGDRRGKAMQDWQDKLITEEEFMQIMRE